jgi:Polyketide cyclase / dehydrase and lipid transport
VSDIAWEIAHSVDVNANPAFAWNYMANVANWDDPPAEFELTGPFQTGSSGTTRTPGQEPRHWRLEEVIPMKTYTLGMPLEGAAISFEWRFEGLTDGRVRLTQHIVLKGENAIAYVEQMQAVFAANLAPGMTRIATAMERAAARY